MSRALIVHSAGPGVTVQDQGRPGYLAFGLSRGGAVDRLALAEGAALLQQSETLAALEMPGMGGEFEATEDMRIALTGAPMRASIDGTKLLWNASHLLPAGARLTIGPVESGTCGYLHLGGGVNSPLRLGSRSTHLAAALGERVSAGMRLPVGADKANSETGLKLPLDARFSGGTVRLVPSLQTAFFSKSDLERFEATTFTRDTRGNRMGVRILPDGEGFATETGLSVVSEVIVPGDVQVTGDGTPFVLLSESQTTGGYPRIGSVLPADLPKVAQAGPGTNLRFVFVSLAEALEAERREATRRMALRARTTPILRDPATISDLLSYQLISGMIAGDEFDN